MQAHITAQKSRETPNINNKWILQRLSWWVWKKALFIKRGKECRFSWCWRQCTNPCCINVALPGLTLSTAFTQTSDQWTDCFLAGWTVGGGEKYRMTFAGVFGIRDKECKNLLSVSLGDIHLSAIQGQTLPFVRYILMYYQNLQISNECIYSYTLGSNILMRSRCKVFLSCSRFVQLAFLLSF